MPKFTAIESIQKSFADRFNNPEQSDFAIRVGDKLIHVQRQVLAYLSRHLRPMLSGRWISPNTREIEITEYEYDIIYAYIKYLYTGAVEITAENLQQLFSLAHCYMETDLGVRCEMFLDQLMKSYWCMQEDETQNRYNRRALMDMVMHFGSNKIKHRINYWLDQRMLQFEIDYDNLEELISRAVELELPALMTNIQEFYVERLTEYDMKMAKFRRGLPTEWHGKTPEECFRNHFMKPLKEMYHYAVRYEVDTLMTAVINFFERQLKVVPADCVNSVGVPFSLMTYFYQIALRYECYKMQDFLERHTLENMHFAPDQVYQVAVKFEKGTLRERVESKLCDMPLASHPNLAILWRLATEHDRLGNLQLKYHFDFTFSYEVRFRGNALFVSKLRDPLLNFDTLYEIAHKYNLMELKDSLELMKNQWGRMFDDPPFFRQQQSGSGTQQDPIDLTSIEVVDLTSPNPSIQNSSTNDNNNANNNNNNQNNNDNTSDEVLAWFDDMLESPPNESHPTTLSSVIIVNDGSTSSASCTGSVEVIRTRTRKIKHVLPLKKQPELRTEASSLQDQDQRANSSPPPRDNAVETADNDDDDNDNDDDNEQPGDLSSQNSSIETIELSSESSEEERLEWNESQSPISFVRSWIQRSHSSRVPVIVKREMVEPESSPESSSPSPDEEQPQPSSTPRSSSPKQLRSSTRSKRSSKRMKKKKRSSSSREVRSRDESEEENPSASSRTTRSSSNTSRASHHRSSHRDSTSSNDSSPRTGTKRSLIEVCVKKLQKRKHMKKS